MCLASQTQELLLLQRMESLLPYALLQTPTLTCSHLTQQAVIDRLSYADAPRPFKSKSFVSHLPSRTATSSSTSVRKNAKQILALERERYLGGDGFLSAQHVAMRKRGEKIELGKKKKGVAKKGNIQNLLKGKMKRDAEETPGTQEQTPAESRMTSEGTTPTLEEDEDMDMDQKERPAVQAPPGDSEDGRPKKEIVTCKSSEQPTWTHTPRRLNSNSSAVVAAS